MMTWRRGSELALILAFVSVVPAAFADFNLSVKIDALHLGQSILGPKVGAAELNGHVVLVEFWGIQ